MIFLAVGQSLRIWQSTEPMVKNEKRLCREQISFVSSLLRARQLSHTTAAAMRRIASASFASSAAKLMRKPPLPPKAEAATIATP
jgi:hypothetical protein